MEKFTQLTGVVAPLPRVNVDTDALIPKQFLTTIERTGLGKYLFNDWRYEANGNENPDFVLNKSAYRKAQILVTKGNFGCGSSREHAPWALADFGIRCVIAPSFADIFFNNSSKNGILLIVLPENEIDRLLVFAAREGVMLTVDLEGQKIEGEGFAIPFKVDPFKRQCLLNGLDDIGLTEQHLPEIETYEEKIAAQRSWV